jgi:hypothetical protein
MSDGNEGARKRRAVFRLRLLINIPSSAEAGSQVGVGDAHVHANELRLYLRIVACEGVNFGLYGRSVCRADSLGYLVSTPEQPHGSGGMTSGCGAAAQAGQCVSLVWGTADSAGQF